MKIFASWVLVIFLGSGGSVKEVVIENISNLENCEKIGRTVKAAYLEMKGMTLKQQREYDPKTLNLLINFFM